MKFKESKESLDDIRRTYEVIQEAIEVYGEHHQLLVAIEELSELQKALTKLLRIDNVDIQTAEGLYDALKRTDHIAEEAADVTIMLFQIAEIFGIGEQINAYKKQKIERLAKRVATEQKKQKEKEAEKK